MKWRILSGICGVIIMLFMASIVVYYLLPGNTHSFLWIFGCSFIIIGVILVAGCLIGYALDGN